MTIPGHVREMIDRGPDRVPGNVMPEAMMARAIRTYLMHEAQPSVRGHALRVASLTESWYGRSMPSDPRVARFVEANIVNRVVRNCRIGRISRKARPTPGWRTAWADRHTGTWLDQ